MLLITFWSLHADHSIQEIKSVQNTCNLLQSQSLISLHGVQKHFSRACSRKCNKYGDWVNAKKKCKQKLNVLRKKKALPQIEIHNVFV